MASPIFKALLCKETGLYQEEVELPEKKYQSVVWMLDYLNPRIRFHISGLLLCLNICIQKFVVLYLLKLMQCKH